ncbi:hypothetical protein HPB50_007846 [Hyalomma asiaticum]|uniref:Uncharacterized protein n=1 Tax=Hyalomma asiaticum TaxID=266040 RepID=A0ACB7T6E0_HYAAI|nr:hypothetical protein HPB50_007846 [Hyalomma asiaticum]
MKKVEACGFNIVQLVTDNHKVNVNAMKLLGNDLVTCRTEHPCDPDRQLFMSFDPRHVLNNVRSQLLSHDIGPELDEDDRCNRTVDIYQGVESPPVTEKNRGRPLHCTYRIRVRPARDDWVVFVRFIRLRIGEPSDDRQR